MQNIPGQNMSEDELVALRKRKIASMTKEDWQNQMNQVMERAAERDRKKFHQEQLALRKREQESGIQTTN